MQILLGRRMIRTIVNNRVSTNFVEKIFIGNIDKGQNLLK
jgi:hypothetical protein